MQYKIPQNVGIEDKIVGPLTLRQLIMLAGGSGVSYVLFAVLSKLYELNILEYIVIAFPLIVSAAFAMVKINNIPLLKFVFLFLEFSMKPKKRVWDHRGIEALVSPDLSVSKPETATKEEEDKNSLDQKAKKASNLRDLSRVLDTGGFEHLDQVEHTDIDKTHDDDLMTEAYFGQKKNETGNMYWRTKESHIEMLNMLAKMPITKLKKGTKETEIVQKEIAKVKEEVTQMRQKSGAKSKAKPQVKPTPPVRTDVSPGGQKAVQQAKPAPPKPAPQRGPQPGPQSGPQQKTAPPAPPKTAAIPSKSAKGGSGGQAQQSGAKPPAGKQPAATNQGAQPPAQTGGQAQQQQATTKKKPRKRKRKIPQPIRENNQVNTTNKNQPANYIPKAKNAPKPTQQNAEKDMKSGEFDIRDLEKGEIEFKL